MEKKTRANDARKTGTCGFFRLLRVLLAVLGPVAIITAAAVVTIIEGDWWSELFYMYLALFTLLGVTTYLSLLTFLWELTRRAVRRVGVDLRDTPFTRVLHRILLPVAVAGLITAAVIPLILADLINGRFVLIHFGVGGILAVLYGIAGVYAIIRRVTDHRGAERQRLEDEKRAWEGYLT